MEDQGAIGELSKDKSSGEDGLTAECYMEFRETLAPILSIMYNVIPLNGSLSKSQKMATLCLIYKKGDCRSLKNWRPVSLLNLDYKILTKIMTQRLLNFREKLVPSMQKCAVPGRKAMNAIALLDVVQNESEESGGALICLDQEKAFDRVNHVYLIKVLEKMGISGSVLKTIKAMHNQILTQVNINGKISKQIQISRSVRQGCPLSMMLFVLISVPLMNMIENEEGIKGHKTRAGNTVKMVSFADDNTIKITDPISYVKMFEIYEKHALASKAKINESKTEILLMGEWRARGNLLTKFWGKVKPLLKS
jgi:hypothetical protein